MLPATSILELKSVQISRLNALVTAGFLYIRSLEGSDAVKLNEVAQGNSYFSSLNCR